MSELHSPLPRNWQVERAETLVVEALADLEAAVRISLRSPLASLPLADLCGSGSRVTVAVADPARRCPVDLMLPPVLRELDGAGVRAGDVTILVANDGRALQGERAMREWLGADAVADCRMVEHDPHDAGALNDLGYVDGIQVLVNHRAVDADLLIAIGAVEPHPYAGYTGGPETVALGLSGAQTIGDLHGMQFMDDPRVSAGSVHDNPLQRAVREIARRAGLLFCVDAVLSGERAVAVRAGAPTAAHDSLVEIARDVHEVTSRRSNYNVVLIGNGAAPRTLFETSSVAADLGGALTPVLARHGVFIVPVQANDGEADDDGRARRRNFYQALMDGGSVAAAAQRLRSRGLRMGEHRAYRLARAMTESDYRMIVVGSDRPDVVRDCGLLSAATMDEAAGMAESLQFGDTMRALIVPSLARIVRPMYGVARKSDDGAAAEDEPRCGRERSFSSYYDIQPITEFKRAKS